jgi:hypothetical protein
MEPDACGMARLLEPYDTQRMGVGKRMPQDKQSGALPRSTVPGKLT